MHRVLGGAHDDDKNKKKEVVSTKIDHQEHISNLKSCLRKTQRELGMSLTFMDNLPTPLCVVDIGNGIIYYQNKAFEQTFGNPHGNANGSLEKYKTIWDECEANDFKPVIKRGEKKYIKTREGEIGEKYFDHTYIASTERIFLQSEGKTGIKHIGHSSLAKGKRKLLQIQSVDSTERVLAEETEVVLRKKAQEADELKTAFLANMSHEIRTPLNGILGFAEMLQKAGLSQEKILKYASTILKSGNQLSSIVNDVVDISKIEAGLLDIHPGEMVVEEFREHNLSMISKIAAKQGGNIQISFESTIPYAKIIVDEFRLEQILINLVSNAVKFSDPSKTKKSEGQIAVTLSLKDESTLMITVQDNGIGIADESQQIIFEKFRQAKSSTTKDFGGSGLGLHITKRLANLMGGDVFLKSEQGVGSTFTVLLHIALPNKPE